MTSTAEALPVTNTWARKRKRNNSSVSLPDGIRAPESTPNTSPKLTAPHPHLSRLSTPPLIRDENPPPSSAGAEQSVFGEGSPIVDKVIQHASASGSNSPRTIVARRLSTMSLEKGENQPVSEITAVAQPILDDLTTTSDPMSQMTLSDTLSEEESKLQTTSQAKAGNTPRPDNQRSSSAEQPPKKRLPPARGIKSPPPKGATSYNTPNSSNLDSFKSSTELDSAATTENWFDLSALTWKDAEITGHLMLDPEDDGEGINGIGFRPTPSMAVERSRRRKQQLTAWRTREEREERERRIEKRRQAISDSAEKKNVRFSV